MAPNLTVNVGLGFIDEVLTTLLRKAHQWETLFIEEFERLSLPYSICFPVRELN